MIVDFTGQKFGKLYVEERFVENKRSYYKCRCDCGNIIIRRGDYFRKDRRENASCGCFIIDFNRKTFMKDIVGEKFGRLLVIEEFKEEKRKNQIKWLCLCDCGNFTIVRGDHLRRNITISCDCYKREIATTHGQSDNRIYTIWQGMMTRCYRTNEKGYNNYGGRGITVCKRWFKFENFYEDMGTPPENMTLERIDVNGNYCKENCRWATMKEQQRNKRNNVYFNFYGKDIVISELAENLGINNSSTFRYRLTSGWSLDQTLGIEPRNGKLYKHPDLMNND